jgi:hypothetical protein
MLGLKSFRTAEITLAGIELAHRIRKGQFSVGDSVRGGCCSLKQQWDLALTRGHADPGVYPDVSLEKARARRQEAWLG